MRGERGCLSAIKGFEAYGRTGYCRIQFNWSNKSSKLKSLCTYISGMALYDYLRVKTWTKLQIVESIRNCLMLNWKRWHLIWSIYRVYWPIDPVEENFVTSKTKLEEKRSEEAKNSIQYYCVNARISKSYNVVALVVCI